MNIWIVRDRTVSETRNQLTLQQTQTWKFIQKKNIKRNKKKNTKNKEKIHWTIKIRTCFFHSHEVAWFLVRISLAISVFFLVEHSHFLCIRIDMLKGSCLFFSRSTCWAVMLHGSRGARTTTTTCNSISQLVSHKKGESNGTSRQTFKLEFNIFIQSKSISKTSTDLNCKWTHPM